MVIKVCLEKAALALAFFNDLPPFLLWVITHSAPIVDAVVNEPLAAIAILIALIAVVLAAWAVINGRPPVL